jgi:hypothetical protein
VLLAALTGPLDLALALGEALAVCVAEATEAMAATHALQIARQRAIGG